MNTNIRINRAKKYARKFIRHFQAKALVLLYHRVSDYDTDPQLLCVTPINFEKHLQVIKENYFPISLTELGKQLQSGKIKNKSLVITFDDGYADNLYFGKQLLDKYNVPATVFTVSGLIGSNREFWWDDLERLILLPDKLPEKFDLYINGEVHTWVMDDSTQSLVNDWNVQCAENPSPRYGFYRDLHLLLKSLNHNDIEKVLDQIISHIGASSKGRDTHRIIAKNELLELSNSDLKDIGAHTVNHPQLSSLSYNEQVSEIKGGKENLSELICKSVNVFSYPFGGKTDYNLDSKKIVEDSGFKFACSNFPGTVTKLSDPYELPRVLVRDWDGNEFARRLLEWFHG